MSTTPASALVDLIAQNEQALLTEWVREQERAATRRPGLLSSEDLERDAREFLMLLRETLRTERGGDVSGPGWSRVHDHLAQLSRSRAEAGFSPSETAMFVFSFKQPLFALLTDELADDAEGLARALWDATVLLDNLGLRTTEEYQRAREAVIERQQRELMDISTPVVKLWDGVLAVPLIGTLDSERTQIVMETLLQGIVDTNSTMAIIDITGVPTVDTLVAQHLLKTVAAARLMGADCIISGIRPQIAQTIVHLGLDAFRGDDQGNDGRRDRARFRARRPDDHKAGRRSVMTGEERIPILKMGQFLLVTIQVDMHDRLALSLQDDLTERIVKDGRPRRADRHLRARGRRLVHRQDAREHRRHGASARRRDGRRRHAPRRCDHARRARSLAAGRSNRAQRRARDGVAQPLGQQAG